MNKRLLAILVVAAIAAAVVYAQFPNHEQRADAPQDYRSATYSIEGAAITLLNGEESHAAGTGAAMVTTKLFGNEAYGDINGDGTTDVTFLLTQDGGGSGTFYYVVAALKIGDGYVGTNGVLLGDRIAPQTTEIRDGTVIVNYAERALGEPMTARPSVGVSKYLHVIDGRLVVRTNP